MKTTRNVPGFKIPWLGPQMSHPVGYGPGMKLNISIVQHRSHNTVQQFGRAKLVQHRNGRHELIGGSATDRAAAIEWVSCSHMRLCFQTRDRNQSSSLLCKIIRICSSDFFAQMRKLTIRDCFRTLLNSIEIFSKFMESATT
jgi:hypothetical protein